MIETVQDKTSNPTVPSTSFLTRWLMPKPFSLSPKGTGGPSVSDGGENRIDWGRDAEKRSAAERLRRLEAMIAGHAELNAGRCE